MIFEKDFRQTAEAVVGTAHFATSASRVFSILNDPSSWGQIRTPRVASATAPSRIVLTFDGVERATVSISSWSTDFCQLEVVLDGFQTEKAKVAFEDYWSQIWLMLKGRLGNRASVLASSPAKVNVFFAVGAFLKNGFHEVASCYQALSLREIVSVEREGRFSISFAGPFAAQSRQLVPTDASNLVYKAGVELQKLNPEIYPEQVGYVIHKSVPIAGGMAGGSADGAAALVALNKLFEADLEAKLPKAAAKLGSDVPFSLIGGTAIGTGRGEKLSKVETESILHWVLTPSQVGLSTPEVYRKLDILRTESGVDVSALDKPEVPQVLIDAVVSGDAIEVANFMHNDLEVAALALRPELAVTIEAGRKAGAIKSMMSGSGPTIVHLAKDRIHAEQIASRLAVVGLPSIATYTSVTGTRLEN
jgi:4-diphosphocytidyl-2-C-methyl-D-erythritol kinase